jgi:dihydrofolate synthase/folylpolyglutamate synthase
MAKSVDQILRRLELFGIRLGLETTTRLLAQLARPQDRFASILIAGTNGKGSTAALLSSILSAAGYRTGLYTSPHLEHVTERVRVDGQVLPEAQLAESLGRVVAAAEAGGSPPTYFEALTVAALDLFAASEVEVAVLEVGMGGRLDATNVVDPVLSLIAEISVDHGEHLGSETVAIAREKGGVLRTGCPALAAPGSAPASLAAAAALTRLASERGARLEQVAETTRAVWGPLEGGTREVDLATPAARYRLGLRLLGDHQLANLALAVRAAEVLHAAGWERVDGSAIATGVARCRWPGRLELVDSPGLRPVLLDAAHNASGVERLAAFLDGRAEPFDLLFGALADKPVEVMLRPLAERATRVFLTEPASDRACPLERLVPLVGAALAGAGPQPARVLDAALAESSERLLVVCGSIYLLGEVRARLRELTGRPAPAADPLW